MKMKFRILKRDQTSILIDKHRGDDGNPLCRYVSIIKFEVSVAIMKAK